MDDETRDWISATKSILVHISESIDIHHIFPVAYAKNMVLKKDYIVS